MKFEEALPRLAASYDRGLLAPFLGAGMSRPACPDWAGFIGALEQQCGIEEDAADGSATDLVRRGNRAVRILKRRDPGGFPEAVKKALYARGDRPPPQTVALGKIWWPLVLTTNYDHLFAQAFRKSFGRPDAVTVLGRSPQDCQQVLSSLDATGGCCLWALQGYLARGRSDAGVRHLSAELVVGHQEYRMVAHTAQHFRRAFAEVFRRRSFFFLGSSLGDGYLLDLFSEVLELSGANPHPHYALVKGGTADVSFLRSRFNIIALEYDDHDQLPRWLDALRGEISGRRTRPVRWSYSLSAAAPPGAGETADVELVRGMLPPPAPGELVAVSVGTGSMNTLWPGQKITAYVKRFWPRPLYGSGYVIPSLGPSRLHGFPRPDGSGVIPVIAVLARIDEHDRRDLRVIGEASTQLFEWAAEQGYGCVRMQLLASGRTAHFPAHFSLAETLRAYGRWRRRTDTPLRLTIHLVHPGALFELSSGRMDVVELLTAEDVRFWVEVVDSRSVLERELVFARPEHTVGELAERFDVGARGWSVEVNPHPRKDSRAEPLANVGEADLLKIGVIPGATLRFVAPPRVTVPNAGSAQRAP